MKIFSSHKTFNNKYIKILYNSIIDVFESNIAFYDIEDRNVYFYIANCAKNNKLNPLTMKIKVYFNEKI